MRKIFTLAAALLLFAASYAAVYEVDTYAKLYDAFNNGRAVNELGIWKNLTDADTIRLTADVTGTYLLNVAPNKKRTLDLNGHAVERQVASPEGIETAIRVGADASLFLLDEADGLDAAVICRSSVEAPSSIICAVDLAGNNARIDAYGGPLVSRVNNENKSYCYGIVLGSYPGITANLYINTNGIYDRNGIYEHKVNLCGGSQGFDDRMSYGMGYYAVNPSRVSGRFAKGYICGTNLSAAALLSLIPVGSTIAIDYTPKTREQVAAMTDLSQTVVYVIPNYNLSIGGNAVTETNASDILGNGTMRFDLRTNTLYLKGVYNDAKEIGSIVYSDMDLTMDVEGIWRVVGTINTNNRNLTIQAHHTELVWENADRIMVHPNTDGIAIDAGQYGSVAYINRVWGLAEAQNASAIRCHSITVSNSWLHAEGKKPVVDCTTHLLYNTTITSGSFKNHDIVVITPNTQSYMVEVEANDLSLGTVSGGGSYPEGTVVTLTATPKSGCKFLRWDDGVTEATRQITVTGYTYYKAFFASNEATYTITLQSADETLGTVVGGGTNLAKNSVITIRAIPADGCEFQYWTSSNGAMWGSEATQEWTVYGDEVLTAHFRVTPDYTEYNVWVFNTRVTSLNQNDILGDGVFAFDEQTYTLSNMKKAIYNKKDTGFLFDQFATQPLRMEINHPLDITCTTTKENSITWMFLMNKGIEFYGETGEVGTPNKVLKCKAVDMVLMSTNSLSVGGGMAVDLSVDAPNNSSYCSKAILLNGSNPFISVDASSLYITAPDGGKATDKTDASILQLTDAYVKSGSITSRKLFIVDNSQRYWLACTDADILSLCSVNGYGYYRSGQRVTLTAFPINGYEFVQWSDGVVDNPRIVTIANEDLTIDPIVRVQEDPSRGAEINADVNDETMGYIAGFESGWYKVGTQLSINAIAYDGYEFVQWSDGETANPYILTVENGKNISLTAVFRLIGEGIENVNVDGDAPVKVLHDGHVYILRKGKIYTIQGVEMK